MKARSADFGIGEFPDSLDKGRMRRVEGIYGNGDGASETGGYILKCVYVVGKTSHWW